MASGKSVVLGYDRSPGAERALRIAIEVADSFGVPLVLVHGVHPPGGVGEEARIAEQALLELDESIAAPAVAADEHDALVIVVGTWSESPLRGALLGSVAHKLLQLSSRPVLCVPAPVPD